jgi:hypothetical protein
VDLPPTNDDSGNRQFGIHPVPLFLQAFQNIRVTHCSYCPYAKELRGAWNLLYSGADREHFEGKIHATHATATESRFVLAEHRVLLRRSVEAGSRSLPNEKRLGRETGSGGN